MGFGFIYDASKADGFYKKDYAVQEGWTNSLEKDIQTTTSNEPKAPVHRQAMRSHGLLTAI